MKKKINYLKKNKGYTLLFAVIVSSVVLSIGISILTISKKEFLLSSSARESTSAFNAADSALECILFWENEGKLATSSTGFGSDTIECGGISVPISYSITSTGPYGGVYSVSSLNIKTEANNTGNTACALVNITKDYYLNSNISASAIIRTKIESRGYNMGWETTVSSGFTQGSCTGKSPKKVERAIEYTY